MEIEKLKSLIKHSEHLLPLSFLELTYKDSINSEQRLKVVKNAGYKDINYAIYTLYKPISRF